MKLPILMAVAGLALASATPSAEAASFDRTLSAPSLTDTVACRVVRERIQRPDGRMVVREVRRCGGPQGMMDGRYGGWHRGGMDRDCRVVRDRIQRPDGSVDIRTRRICR